MPVSMYTISIPVFIRTLTGASGCLDRATAHAAEHNLDMNFILNMRLYPNMFSYKRQVQQATMLSAAASCALAEIKFQEMPNTEEDVPQLKARIANTIELLGRIPSDQIDGREEKDVTIRVGSRDRSFNGQGLLLDFILPNFYFHCTTAYDILRHCGVPLQKRDFTGAPNRP